MPNKVGLPAKPWPKLSETLDGRYPGECQDCGRDTRLTYWIECDEDDRYTPVFVVLCKGCADAIIEPHPRLYVEQSANTPAPGAMPICADCPQRPNATLRCVSPLARFNGGPGLEYEPKGSMVHVCRSPRRSSGWQYLASGPVTKCSGKQPTAGGPP